MHEYKENGTQIIGTSEGFLFYLLDQAIIRWNDEKNAEEKPDFEFHQQDGGSKPGFLNSLKEALVI
jgi:hypothetical protein